MLLVQISVAAAINHEQGTSVDVALAYKSKLLPLFALIEAGAERAVYKCKYTLPCRL